MRLDQYLQQTQLLLNDPKEERFNLFDLITYVNTARGQVAGEGECIRAYGSLSVDPSSQQFPFSLITFPSGPLGVGGAINIRMATYNVGVSMGQLPVLSGGSGTVISVGPGQVLQTGPTITTTMGNLRINAREWEWFNNYVLSQPAPRPTPPKYWAQFGQGANGTIFINLLDAPYILTLDTVCFPISLVGASDIDAVPYYWSDAVPYYAAYLALLTTPGGEKSAAEMFQRYQLFAHRARTFAIPSVLPHQYAQAPDITLPAKIGMETRQPQQGTG